MQNIDPVLLLEPAAYIAISVGLILYWRAKRSFAGIVLLFSLIAYAGAIALKEVFQAYTYGGVTSEFGSVSWETGVYFGAQTSVFEVGLAYLVARYAVSRKMMAGADAEAYGISLAFWENGILLGASDALQPDSELSPHRGGAHPCLGLSDAGHLHPFPLLSSQAACSPHRPRRPGEGLLADGSLRLGIPLRPRRVHAQEDLSRRGAANGPDRRNRSLRPGRPALGVRGAHLRHLTGVPPSRLENHEDRPRLGIHGDAAKELRDGPAGERT